ncbi:hypothetical protein, partial [Hymenobacter antarcticus]|uniref:hypothetical protein n=1 Tax=Hymenobacter antarcticus TaxID=486270 RepID=UPI0031E508CC
MHSQSQERELKARKTGYFDSHTATPTGFGTRSLNVWKRQIVRVACRKGSHRNYERNIKLNS